MKIGIRIFQAFVYTLVFTNSPVTNAQDHELRYLQIAAQNKFERTELANLGFSIEAVRSDSVWGFADPLTLSRLRESGIEILGDFDVQVGRGGHGQLGFPGADSRYHDYAEMKAMLTSLETQYQGLAKIQSIGKSLQGKDIWAIHLNSSSEDLASGTSDKPGVIFMGTHHAREHLSTEIPLMLTEYLLKNWSSLEASLSTRDIWIIPMVNPDGVEWDITGDRYKMWRKNRRDNGNGTYGVDLNRNYGFMWGGEGSSSSPSSEIYRGKEAFSEPETQVIRDFVTNHRSNATILLTFHTFSELILYPWGHKYDPISQEKDQKVFQTMAEKMATWNKYTPQQSSDLYIASGDTTDWAYGELGMFAFTFELSPTSMWNGGFYPGPEIIDQVFNDNLRPCLYMIDISNDPYQVLDERPTGFLTHYKEPKANSPVVY